MCLNDTNSVQRLFVYDSWLFEIKFCLKFGAESTKAVKYDSDARSRSNFFENFFFKHQLKQIVTANYMAATISIVCKNNPQMRKYQLGVSK